MAVSRARKVFELVGRITAAWNEIEIVWYLIYTCMLHEAPREKIDLIYRQFVTGRAQRQFVIALADVAFKADHHQIYRTAMGKLFARTGELSGLRNALIHGDYTEVIEGDGTHTLRIAPGGDMAKRNKLGGKPLEAEMVALLASITDLVCDLDRLRIVLGRRYPPREKRAPRLPREIREALQRQGFQAPGEPNQGRRAGRRRKRPQPPPSRV